MRRRVRVHPNKLTTKQLALRRRMQRSDNLFRILLPGLSEQVKKIYDFEDLELIRVYIEETVTPALTTYKESEEEYYKSLERKKKK